MPPRHHHALLISYPVQFEVPDETSFMHGSCTLQVMVWDPDVNKAISHVLEIEKELQANMKIEVSK